MDDYIRQRANAAKWVEKNRIGASWWTFNVLTTYNTAPNSLKLSEQIAILIWTDWVDKGFFIETPEKQNGQTAYFFNPGRTKEWHDVMYPPNILVLTSRWAIKNLVYPLIIAGVTAFITTIVNNKYAADSFEMKIESQNLSIHNLADSITVLNNKLLILKSNTDTIVMKLNSK